MLVQCRNILLSKQNELHEEFAESTCPKMCFLKKQCLAYTFNLIKWTLPRLVLVDKSVELHEEHTCLLNLVEGSPEEERPRRSVERVRPKDLLGQPHVRPGGSDGRQN